MSSWPARHFVGNVDPSALRMINLKGVPLDGTIELVTELWSCALFELLEIGPWGVL